MDIKQDPERLALPETGIYVRAMNPQGRFASVDIVTLDRPSLMNWLRSRGGSNEWAENTVAALLGWAPPDGG
jgi:hypothetical protein